MTDVGDDSVVTGTLFSGIQFFLVRRCPMRSTFISQITANGGTIVIIEKNADIIIADHVRKDGPPGSYSYTFIEQSIANGKLEDPEDHIAVPATQESRPVGSVTRPTKTGSRVPFTVEDKAFLRKWVTDSLARGAVYEKGNKIFEQLEKVNPRHTFQSWRDHWIKYESKRLPAAQARSPTPPLASEIEPQTTPSTAPARSKGKPSGEQASPSTLQKLQAIKAGKLPQNETRKEIKKGIPPAHKPTPQVSSVPDVRPEKVGTVYTTKAVDMISEQSTTNKLPPSPLKISRHKDAKLTQSPLPQSPTLNIVANSDLAMDLISREQSTDQLPPSPQKISRHTDPASVPSALPQSPTLNIEANSDDPEMIASPRRDLRSPTANTRSPLAAKTLQSPLDVLQNLRQSPELHLPAQRLLQEPRRSFTPIQGQRLSYGAVEEVEIDMQDFSEVDIDILKNEAHHIQNIIVGKYKKAWDDFAVQHPRHNALQWRAFYEMEVLPWYEEQEAQKIAAVIEEEASSEYADEKNDEETEYSDSQDSVKDQWKHQQNLHATTESEKDASSDEEQSDSSNSNGSEGSGPAPLLNSPPSIIDTTPPFGTDSAKMQSVEEESSPLITHSKAKVSMSDTVLTLATFAKPSAPSISPIQEPSLGPFHRPQFLDLTNSSSPDQGTAVDDDIASMPIPLSPSVKSEVSPQKRKRNSDGNDGVSSSFGPLKTVKVESPTIKMERPRSPSPKYLNKWAEAIGRRRSGRSKSRSGSGRIPTSPSKIAYISLISDDEEDHVQVPVKPAKITQSPPQAIPEEEEMQEQALDDSMSIDRRESSADSIEMEYNTFAEPYEQESAEIIADDEYGPESQILVETSRVVVHDNSLLDGETTGGLKVPELDAEISEDDEEEADGATVRQDVQERASTDEASEQLQFEANAATIHVFENEAISGDDKENQDVLASRQSSPVRIYANAEESLVSPFKAFGSQPKNFHLVTHEGSWTGDIEMQDDTEAVTDGASHPLSINNLESQATEAENFASAQEQLTASAGSDEPNVMDEDNENSVHDEQAIDVESELFLTRSESPSSIQLHSQMSFSDSEDSGDDKGDTIVAPEPDPSTADTQTILMADTQELDLTVPSPHISRRKDFGAVDTQTILVDDTQGLDLDVPFPPRIPNSIPHSATRRETIKRVARRDSSPAPELSPSPKVKRAPKAKVSTYSSSRRRTYDQFRRPERPSPSLLFRSSPPVMPTSSRRRTYATPTPAQQASRATPRSTAFSSTQMPAQPSEADIDAFLTEQLALGHDHADVCRAMKATTLDLRLAEIILEAYKRTAVFPTKKRGVWTDEDDEIMRSSNAHAMGELELWHGKSRTHARLLALEAWDTVAP